MALGDWQFEVGLGIAVRGLGFEDSGWGFGVWVRGLGFVVWRLGIGHWGLGSVIELGSPGGTNPCHRMYQLNGSRKSTPPKLSTYCSLLLIKTIS